MKKPNAQTIISVQENNNNKKNGVDLVVTQKFHSAPRHRDAAYDLKGQKKNQNYTQPNIDWPAKNNRHRRKKFHMPYNSILKSKISNLKSFYTLSHTP